MKITCQACQSKYTIADDKIQGKVAKIRCRKCGATVLVDASTGGGRGNGSVAPPATNEVWLVSVAEGDQRPMQLQEVIDAYNSGVIVGDTYLWKEGMGDWQPLSEIAEIVNALNEANAAAVPAEDYQVAAAPVADYAPPAPYTPPTAYTPQPSPAVAARRETSRGRGDLFGGGVAVEEEVATSAPVHAARGGGGMMGGMSSASTAKGSGLTGARDEQSVLFSLSALTSGAKAPSAPPVAMTASAPSTTSRNEDSGLIDLNALAKAQQASKAAEEAAPLAAPTPFLFPAALGTVETFQPAEQKKKSTSMAVIIGGGVGIAGIAIAIALAAGGKKEEVPLPATTASALAEPAPAPAASAEPAPADSAPAVASAKSTPKKAPGGGGARAKPQGGGATPSPATPLPPPAPKPKSPCGCASSDLQCQIRCSAVGK
jgi:predicted Zn finger-like uncharacterized protein